ncbi:hydroxyacylglutathione hydrolase [Clostridium homopropionicum DSM 5847]|uniref:Hydroxyacylglutathione hydrolase n=1 Tax=Clostridium homopropionicum DSM 5847 TaxID=1121318 RepID=A0A0L6Z8S7_9CLOT|nr:ComEC/Rec2 family competence protein [Clostridium homopropionicum]KOA19369.1 hydroxyacylglutathione hydrolase [Clostridium homopropionicum DSM 5847]SFG67703.1 Metal-dependent hydrolase, beta-lactamase superfamily II [Clostridium homopropionicum]
MKNKRFSNPLRLIIFLLPVLVFIIALGSNMDTNLNSNSNLTTGINQTENKDVIDKNNLKITDVSANNTEEDGAKVTGNLKVHFINVGQADSILIQQGEHNMLIDAGNNSDSDLVLNYLKNQGVNKLDYVIGTHPHEDHIGGLDVVVKNFSIDKIFLSKVTSNTATFKDVIASIKDKKLNITTPKVDTSYNLGTATWTILAPNSATYDEINNYSIVIRLKYGNNSFMFTGDAESISEGEILEKQLDLKSDVLKIGHHGSSSSTSNSFLNKVSPKYAIISVGKNNDYGHPHKPTMERLKSKGITVYRTDECGTIIATSDGITISFNTKPGSYSYSSSASQTSITNNSSSATNSSGSSSGTISSSKVTVSKPSTESIRTVYYVPKGKSYHFNKNCRTLSRSKTILSGALSDVINLGYSDPCDVCVN